MKNSSIIIALLIIFTTHFSQAQDQISAEALSEDIADHLDLKSIASMFGEATDLEHFEFLINDPEKGVSNLDLNGDGFVDYLRVVEVGMDDLRLVVIQAVLDKDKYQDVATVEVVRDETGTRHVQVVGDVYLYGSNYIIAPVYVVHPPIFTWMWRSDFQNWYNSPYYWSHYPAWYNPWKPHPLPLYRDRRTIYMNYKNNYPVVETRRLKNAESLLQKVKRNDHASRQPDNSFSKRHEGVMNYGKLENRENILKDPVLTDPVAPIKNNSGDVVPGSPAESGKADDQMDMNKKNANPAVIHPRNKSAEPPKSSGKEAPDVSPENTKSQKTRKENSKAKPEGKLVPRNSNTIRKPAEERSGQ